MVDCGVCHCRHRPQQVLHRGKRLSVRLEWEVGLAWPSQRLRSDALRESGGFVRLEGGTESCLVGLLNLLLLPGLWADASWAVTASARGQQSG